MTLSLCASCLLAGCFPVVLAGAGATALVAADRRTAETQLADAITEKHVSRAVADALGGVGHVNATCYNKTLLLTGEVADEKLKEAAGAAARSVDGVKTMNNELVVGWQSRTGDRANDIYIATKVYTRFIDANKFPPKHVKVVSEYRNVYLLGLVTHKEADDAVEIARTTAGVEKVVTAFEYLSDEAAARLDGVFGRQEPADKSQVRSGGS